jgi:NAD(P)-dependent dehydrogenase (short-subunit alcohol dehydrogenase family)
MSQLALITGASRGIGLAVAHALAAEHPLLLVSRSAETLATRKEELLAAGAGEVRCEACDLGDARDRARLIATLESEPVGILVNNAGTARSAPLAHTDAELWQQSLELNLTAPFELCRAFVPGMAKRGLGRVVNIASTAALRGYRYTTAYAASKAGLLGLTRSLALEVARKGVTVNAICPGFTDTAIVEDAVSNIVSKTGQSQEGARQALESFSPQGRLMEPEEIAALVRYLVGEEARGITGQALPVDGGETA